MRRIDKEVEKEASKSTHVKTPYPKVMGKENVYHELGEITTPIRVKKYKSTHNETVRIYYIGRIKIATSWEYEHGTHRAGNIALHVNSRPASGGVWFESSRKALKALKQDLLGEPK